MCLIISILFFIAAYSFYTHALYFQMFFSLILGVLILLYFIIQIFKNAPCFFNTKGCQKR